MLRSRFSLFGMAAATATLVLAGMGASPAKAELVTALTTTNQLFTFDSATPGIVSGLVSITGLGGGESLYDIDIRPVDGQLYSLSTAGRLYVINRTTGIATFNTALSGVSLDSTATRFGIDFNPTVDRLRIVSNTGQDLRLTPGTGVTTVDTPLNGAASGALSVAYTNNDNDPATGTALFYIGPNTPTTLYTTSNPNGGVLTTVGPLGATGTQDVGFDISGLTGVAYASLTSATGSGSSLYTINLGTGSASLIGGIGNGLQVRGIAVQPAVTAAPEPGTLALVTMGVAGAAAFRVRRRRRLRCSRAAANS